MADWRICVVGSGGVGKSCVTIQFLRQRFSEYYDPTIEESYRKPVTVDDEEYNLEIVDTAGQEEFTSFRDSSLSHGDGFLLVFAIISASSWGELKSLREKIQRVKDCDTTPMVIIGNKADLRNERTVTTREAEEYCKGVNCPYLETSAKTGHNVAESFHEVVRQIAKSTPAPESNTQSHSKPRKKGGKGCTLL